MFLQNSNQGTAHRYRNKRTVKWTPSPPSWNKWNRNVSRIGLKKSFTISYVNRDNREKIYHLVGTTIEDCPLVVTETLAIRGAIRTIILMMLDNIIVESDS